MEPADDAPPSTEPVESIPPDPELTEDPPTASESTTATERIETPSITPTEISEDPAVESEPTVSLPPPPELTTATVDVGPPPHPAMRPTGFALLSVAGAAFVGGVVFHTLHRRAEQRHDDLEYDRAPTGFSPHRWSDVRVYREAAVRHGIGAGVCYAIAIVSAPAGAVLLLTHRRRTLDRLHVGPQPLLRGAGLVVGGRM